MFRPEHHSKSEDAFLALVKSHGRAHLTLSETIVHADGEQAVSDLVSSGEKRSEEVQALADQFVEELKTDHTLSYSEIFEKLSEIVFNGTEVLNALNNFMVGISMKDSMATSNNQLKSLMNRIKSIEEDITTALDEIKNSSASNTKNTIKYILAGISAELAVSVFAFTYFIRKLGSIAKSTVTLDFSSSKKSFLEAGEALAVVGLSLAAIPVTIAAGIVNRVKPASESKLTSPPISK